MPSFLPARCAAAASTSSITWASFSFMRQRAALVDVRLGVAEFHAALGAVEQRRGADRVAGGGEAVGHVADVVVDAENLLDHDDPLGRAGGAGGIGGQREAVRRLELDGGTHA